jgi:serine/threonine protein kinase
MNKIISSNGYNSIYDIACSSNSTVFGAIKDNKLYAIKVTSFCISNLLEFELSLRINHPNIVKSIEVFKSKYLLLFLVQNLAENNLYDYILNACDDMSSIDKKLKIIGDIGSGIHFLHSQNIAHGDIKLDNILIHNENFIIADLGSASHIDDNCALLESDIWAYGLLCLSVIYNRILISSYDDLIKFKKEYINAKDRIVYIIDRFGEIPADCCFIFYMVIFHLMENRSSILLFLTACNLPVNEGEIVEYDTNMPFEYNEDIINVIKWIEEETISLFLPRRAIDITIGMIRHLWPKYNTGIGDFKLFAASCLYLALLFVNYDDCSEKLFKNITKYVRYDNIVRFALELYVKEDGIISRYAV